MQKYDNYNYSPNNLLLFSNLYLFSSLFFDLLTTRNAKSNTNRLQK